jgi:hypothetical protein
VCPVEKEDALSRIAAARQRAQGGLTVEPSVDACAFVPAEHAGPPAREQLAIRPEKFPYTTHDPNRMRVREKIRSASCESKPRDRA